MSQILTDLFGDSQAGIDVAILPIGTPPDAPIRPSFNWPTAYSKILNTTVLNHAVGGEQTADMWFNDAFGANLFGFDPAGKVVANAIGTNDWFCYGAGSSEILLMDYLWSAQISYFCGVKKFAKDNPSWFVGSWSQSPLFGGQCKGMQTVTNGDILDFTFTGTFCHIAFIMQDSNANGFNVQLNGGSNPVQIVGSPRAIMTAHGAAENLDRTYAPVAIRITAPAGQTNTLRLTSLIVDPTKPITILWLSTQATANRHYFVAAPLPDPAKFATTPAVLHNSKKQSLCTAFAAQGFNISYADPFIGLVPSTDLERDGSHLAVPGRLNAALAMRTITA